MKKKSEIDKLMSKFKEWIEDNTYESLIDDEYYCVVTNFDDKREMNESLKQLFETFK